jgi:integrase
MPAYKQKTRRGAIKWGYMFSLSGSTRKDRRRVSQSGFSTKRDAEDAEARRRIGEQQKADAAKRGSAAQRIPTTLAVLMEEFFAQHVEGQLAPKTAERYHDQSAYLRPDLLMMPLREITPLHLSREWKRLLEAGGHDRRTKTARPLSKKTVQNIAGVVSSAFKHAIKWGLVSANPVPASEPPVPKRRRGIALTAVQQQALIAAATEPWFLGTFLELCAATGARRGEVLALRWSDIRDGGILITRSLTQTKAGVQFKDTKTDDSVRPISLPPSAIHALARHRRRQEEFRQQFGADYAGGGLIFANPDGTPVKPDSVSASVSALCRRLKMPKGVSLHTLRHTHGSHLIAAGMEITAVSERLGHSSPRVTQDIYAHAIRGRDDEAALKWEQFQKQNTTADSTGVVQ